jgi:hypothetical protein
VSAAQPSSSLKGAQRKPQAGRAAERGQQALEAEQLPRETTQVPHGALQPGQEQRIAQRQLDVCAAGLDVRTSSHESHRACRVVSEQWYCWPIPAGEVDR